MFTYKYEQNDNGKEPPHEKTKPFFAYETNFTAQQIHFYLSGEITEPSEYTDMIHRILVASPSDIIFIHLNTPGGRLDTGIQIVNAMQNSQAKIITVLESMAFSLGTLIFLAGDEMVVNDHCMMMFHNFKGGIGGKGNELISQLEATMKWFISLSKKIYIPFLSEEEFTRVLKGEDLYMHSVEIRKRLDRMIEQLAKPGKPPLASAKVSIPKRLKKSERKVKTDSVLPSVD